MKHIVLGTMLALTLVVTGCESTKKEIMDKKYILIIHHVSDFSCSGPFIDTLAETEGWHEAEHQHADNDVNCTTYGKKIKHDCLEVDTHDMDKIDIKKTAIGTYACVIGSNLRPQTEDNETILENFMEATEPN